MSDEQPFRELEHVYLIYKNTYPQRVYIRELLPDGKRARVSWTTQGRKNASGRYYTSPPRDREKVVFLTSLSRERYSGVKEPS